MEFIELCDSMSSTEGAQNAYIVDNIVGYSELNNSGIDKFNVHLWNNADIVWYTRLLCPLEGSYDVLCPKLHSTVYFWLSCNNIYYSIETYDTLDLLYA